MSVRHDSWQSPTGLPHSTIVLHLGSHLALVVEAESPHYSVVYCYWHFLGHLLSFLFLCSRFHTFLAASSTKSWKLVLICRSYLTFKTINSILQIREILMLLYPSYHPTLYPGVDPTLDLYLTILIRLLIILRVTSLVT